MVARTGLVRYFSAYIGNMDLEQLSRNNEDKKESTHNNSSGDNYEKFLKEQVNNLENILIEHCDTDTDKRVVMSKIITYQEGYIQYLMHKKQR